MSKRLKLNRSWLWIVSLLACLAGFAIVSDGCGGAASETPAARTLSFITVTPENASVTQGAGEQFKAIGNYSDNSTEDLTATATWSSSSATVATISNTGLANGVGFGTTVIKASSGPVTGSTAFRVASSISQYIQHVVVIFQENRTPDNLFHGLPGADIANSGMNSAGQAVPLTPISLAIDYDLGHQHENFVQMYNRGKMDGADRIYTVCDSKSVGCPPANPQYHYVNPADVQPYFDLAEQYTFGDRMFQTNQGPSFPAHQYIIAGTSAPTATSKLFAAENTIVPPHTKTHETAGCNAPIGTLVNLIDPTGSEMSTMFPCFEHPTLTDLLDVRGIDWRYYAPSAPDWSIWVGPDAIKHIRFGSDWSKVILNQKQVLIDIASGHLPQMSWVIPSGQASDHARVNNGSGPSWVAAVVNAIGKSPYWPHTAVIVTWDDWGGWYDHVPPPSIVNSYEYGFRVPLIVVSPYAKHAYVSHLNHDFGSILKFAEEVFDLPSLGYADARSDDLSDCFDWSQVPSTFKPIAAKISAQDFINDNRAPTPPDDDDDE